MQTQRYECTTGGSSKFWTVTVNGNAVTTTWGKIGTDGQSKTQSYKTAQDAAADAQKQINKKILGNYVLAKGAAAAAAKAAKAANAPKAPAKAAKAAKAPAKAVKPARAAKPSSSSAGDPVLLHTKVKHVTNAVIDASGTKIAVSATPIQILDLTGKVLETIDVDDHFDLFFATDGALFGKDSYSKVLRGFGDAAPNEVTQLPKQTNVVGITKDRIASVGWDTFAVFDRKTGKQLVTKKKETSNAFGGKLTPDGKELLAADDLTVQRWSISDGTLRTLEVTLDRGNMLHDAAVSADGKRIVAFAINAYTSSALVAWDAKTGKHAWTKPAQPWFESLMGGEKLFALPDGRFVVAGATGIGVWSSDGDLVANMRLGKEDAAGHWSISGDGTKLACVWKESFVRVFDVETVAAGGIRAKTKPLA